MPVYDKYETVVGLEVHAQLLTNSKLFCGDSIEFGAEPNTQVSPITLAHPGTLPKMNKKAIEFAISMGLALDCTISRQNYFARKNYFYPDLPKGYQVSQHTTPICVGGYVKIGKENDEKEIRLNRIHLEEDAGKSLHDVDENTSVDYNRAGTPLIEIVTEPDIRSGEEALEFLTEIRRLVRYLGICDGNMEEGSLRCDANISVRKKGETALGTKVEVKNLNSIRFIKKAIESEAKRLIDLLESGEKILQQTRSYDPGTHTSFAIRDKEDADDYRYFPEPDLSPFDLSVEFIENVQRKMPELPSKKQNRYLKEFRLPADDIAALTEEKEFAEYFENAAANTTHYKPVANWMRGPIKSWMNKTQKSIDDFPVDPAQLVRLVELVESGKLSFSTASTKLLDQLIAAPSEDPASIAQRLNLLQQSDSAAIELLIDDVIARFPDKVTEYRKGKKGLLALFVGEVMKRSNGKADPKMTNELLVKKLKS